VKSGSAGDRTVLDEDIGGAGEVDGSAGDGGTKTSVTVAIAATPVKATKAAETDKSACATKVTGKVCMREEKEMAFLAGTAPPCNITKWLY
jgi:hypothetical protein